MPYKIIYFLFTFFFYKKTFILNYISPLSVIKHKRNIMLNRFIEIRAFTYLSTSHLVIDSYSQINPGTVIYGSVEIGKYVMIAPNCTIAGGTHAYEDKLIPMRFQNSTPFNQGIVIDEDVWIGANSVILNGVKISKGCIIAAGSVVTKSTEYEYSIYGGVPAKFIRLR